jgi:translation elongation factor EF-4
MRKPFLLPNLSVLLKCSSILFAFYSYGYFLCSQRALLKYRLPLKEIIVDFYNELKGITSGYATFDYEDSE